MLQAQIQSQLENFRHQGGFTENMTVERLNARKSSGFNIEDTHMRDMERIARLVAMVCMALVWAYLVGEHKDININPRVHNK